jgi:poly(A) polymerase
VLKRFKEREARGEHRIPALDAAIDDVLDLQTEKLAIQRRYTSDMREIWMLQPRLERRTGRNAFKLVEHLRLRAGYDFLLLRCAADEAPAELGDWWTRFMHADADTREQLVAGLGRSEAAAGPRKRRRRRGGGGRGGAGANDSASGTGERAATPHGDAA